MPGPYTRENLIRVGFGDWAGHVLRGALEGDARLTFSEEEVVELVTSWLSTPEVEQDEVGGFRAVVLPVGEEPAEGDGIVRQDGRWVASAGAGGGAVSSVAGRTGAVVLAKADVGLALVNNTADADKPVSTATQAAIDVVALSGKWKAPVKAASVANVALGAQGSRTLDGYAASSGDRVLLLVQTAGAENGIYTVGGDFALTRATDANSAAKLTGSAVRVEKGATHADKQFSLDTDDITLGTTPLVWTELPQAVENSRLV
jgi:hypothetical protein